MKLLLSSLIGLTALTSLSNAATTTVGFQISTNPGSFATNFSNSGATGGTTGMYWGIVIDVNGDGFGSATASTDDKPSYIGGFSINDSQTETTLFTSAGTSDDKLFVSSSLTLDSTGATESGGASGSHGTMFSMLGVTIDTTYSGKNFGLIWFDSNDVASTGPIEIGDHYGFLTSVTLAGDFVVPAAAATENFSNNFTGIDPTRAADHTFDAVPEPSSVTLLGLGSVALLLRRRR